MGDQTYGRLDGDEWWGGTYKYLPPLNSNVGL